MALDLATIVIRLSLAFILGGIIGVERELRNQPAGFRTHSILSLGSALYTLVSILAIGYNPKVADPTRISAQIVSGIGFLCAGAIFRIGVNIKGLTTAASLWTTGGIGLACGAGFIVPAIIVSFLVVFSLTILAKFEKSFLLTKPKKSLYVESLRTPNIFAELERVLNSLGYGMDFVEVERSKEKMEINLVIIPLPGKSYVEQTSVIADKVASIEGVISVEIR